MPAKQMYASARRENRCKAGFDNIKVGVFKEPLSGKIFFFV
jgi:hypothetical protein